MKTCLPPRRPSPPLGGTWCRKHDIQPGNRLARYGQFRRRCNAFGHALVLTRWGICCSSWCSQHFRSASEETSTRVAMRIAVQ